MKRKEALDLIMSKKQGYQLRMKQLRTQEKQVLKYTDKNALFLRRGDDLEAIPFLVGWERVYSGKIMHGDMYYNPSQRDGWQAATSSQAWDATYYTCVIRKTEAATPKKVKASGIVDIPDGWAVVFSGHMQLGDRFHSAVTGQFLPVNQARAIPKGSLVIRKKG